jgi:hypothetical protein
VGGSVIPGTSGGGATPGIFCPLPLTGESEESGEGARGKEASSARSPGTSGGGATPKGALPGSTGEGTGP